MGREVLADEYLYEDGELRHGWAKWYASAREYANELGFKGIPVDWYREYFAVGNTPRQAANQIRLRKEVAP